MKLSLFVSLGLLAPTLISASPLKGALRKTQQVVEFTDPPVSDEFDVFDIEEAGKKDDRDKGKEKASGDKGGTSTALSLRDGECAVCTPENKIRPTSLTLRYWAGQGVISRFQDSDKADCRDQIFPDNTTISIYGINYDVKNGTEFTFAPPSGQQMGAFTYFTFPDNTQCFVHTSCSQPIVAGDRLGPFEIVIDKNTCLGTSTPAQADENGECVVCDPDNKVRPTSITFEYTGGTGVISKYQTEDKADCRDQLFPDFANITIKDSNLVYSVENGTIFTYEPEKMGAFTYFVFPDGSECFVHTSCSQPIVAGDRFGPFRIMEAANENDCKYIPPTPSPTPSPTMSPTPCVCQAIAEWEDDVITIDFKYCDAEPQKEDWIGIYPCDSETLIADKAWNATKLYDDVFKIGYVENEIYVNAPHLQFGYTCGSPDDGCQRDPNVVWPSQGTIVLDPKNAGSRFDPRSGYWAFPGGPTLEPGCYKTMLNRVSSISAPPYPTVCKEWALGDQFTVPAP